MAQKYCLLLFNCYDRNGTILLNKFAIYKVDKQTLFHYYVSTEENFTVKLDKKQLDGFYIILKG